MAYGGYSGNRSGKEEWSSRKKAPDSVVVRRNSGLMRERIAEPNSRHQSPRGEPGQGKFISLLMGQNLQHPVDPQSPESDDHIETDTCIIDTCGS